MPQKTGLKWGRSDNKHWAQFSEWQQSPLSGHQRRMQLTTGSSPKLRPCRGGQNAVIVKPYDRT